MRTVFDKTNRNELIHRIHSLNENSAAQWGKMNVYQMTKHCIIWNEWVLGKNNLVFKQSFLGKIFGNIALKSNTRDDKPLSKNLPAGKAFTVTGKTGNLEVQKQMWIQLMADYEQFSNENFVHDFFGKMTREQIGVFAYKHADHHLRQFGA